MISVKGLSKHYGQIRAVDQVSFEVEEGKNLVLLGTSGCGKTTTLKMINRLIDPDEGQISIAGKDIFKEKPEILRRNIGYIMQNTGLFPHYTVAENIAVVPKLLKWASSKIDRRKEELLYKLKLPPEILNRFPHELSGGQQQRVGMARALIADPPVLLMDEAFGALDNVTRSSIQEEFKNLDELKRKTIVMVTHDVQEAFDLADHICLMDHGNIIQSGTPNELLYHPVNDYVKNFLDGHRLALEFRNVTLADLLDYLPNEQGDDAETIQEFESVWKAMEELRRYGSKNLRVMGEGNQALKCFNFEQLTAAFYQYQNLPHHE